MSKPKWITQPEGLDGKALQIWKHLAFGAYEAGVLTPGTAEKFKGMVRAMALADVCWGEIQRDGATVTSASGSRRAHPAIKILFEAQREASRLADELRLSDELPGFGLRP